MWCPPPASTDRCGRARGRPSGVEPLSARPVLRTVVRPSTRRRHPVRSSLPGRRLLRRAGETADRCPPFSRVRPGRPASSGSSFPGPCHRPATPTRSPGAEAWVSRVGSGSSACGSVRMALLVRAAAPVPAWHLPLCRTPGPANCVRDLRAGSGRWASAQVRPGADPEPGAGPACRPVRGVPSGSVRTPVRPLAGRHDRVPRSGGVHARGSPPCRGPTGRGTTPVPPRMRNGPAHTGGRSAYTPVPGRSHQTQPFRPGPIRPVRHGSVGRLRLPEARIADPPEGSCPGRKLLLPRKDRPRSVGVALRPPGDRAVGRLRDAPPGGPPGGTAGMCRPGSLPGRGAGRRNGRCRVTVPDRAPAHPCGGLEWITRRIHEVPVFTARPSGPVRPGPSGNRSPVRQCSFAPVRARPLPSVARFRVRGAAARSRTGHGGASG